MRFYGDITEAARWHRCWLCFAAPCNCPPGVGLGRVLAERPAAVELAAAKDVPERKGKR